MGKLESYKHMLGNTYSKKIDDKKVRELYDKGMNDTDIGKALNLSNATIHQWRKKNNLKTHPRRSKRVSKERLLEVYNLGRLTDSKMAELLNKKYGLNETTKSISSARLHYKLRTKVYDKDPIKWTYELFQIALGASIADGHLNTAQSPDKAILNFAHSLKQEKYALWKRDKLSEVFKFSTQYGSNKDKRTGRTYYRISTTSRAYKELRNIYNGLYFNGDKQPCKAVIDCLDALAFAVIYMDDGYLVRGACNIAFCSFSDATNRLFINRLNELGIKEVTLQSDGIIYISRKYSKVFIKMVEPYIQPELMYKIGK